MEKLKKLKKRLADMGIIIEYTANYPWIYLYKINEQMVKEKYQGNHGFTVAFLPIKQNELFHFTDISEIFNLIRKYVIK